MKLLTIVGARPQFIKAAIFSKEIQNNVDIEEVLVHTGQHYDDKMSEIFFQQLGLIAPKYNLSIGNCSHGAMTGRQIEKIEEILLIEMPDYVVVFGDTNSTLAGAIAASKLNISIVHIEAGLRSFNKKMPEEINRILTDHVSEILFTPSELSKNNLINEGIDKNKIFVVGDIMFDAAIYYKSKSLFPSQLSKRDVNISNFILCTLHRQETLSNIEYLSEIFQIFAISNKVIILPLHPHTKKIITQYSIEIPNNVIVLEPVGYLEMTWLLANCNIVVTDSGGLQKEAFFHRKFCITLRNETEWEETVDSGNNILVGNNLNILKTEIFELSKNFNDSVIPYGNGDSAFKMLEILKDINGKERRN